MIITFYINKTITIIFAFSLYKKEKVSYNQFARGTHWAYRETL